MSLIGIDEVGRGCLAGPLLVVAAKQDASLPTGLRDSKLLSRKQREALMPLLLGSCKFGEGWVSAQEIDKSGLSQCLRLGARRALRALGATLNEQIIVDGKVNYIPKQYVLTQSRIRADNLVPIVSAASIYAKVVRDRYMANLARKYPAYRFEQNVGYGTAAHYSAIKSLGAVRRVHRLSFAPFKGEL